MFVGEIGFLCLLGQRSPGGEPCPVLHVCFISCAPTFVACLKSVFCPDDLALEERGQGWMVFSQTLYPKVSAERGLSHINMLDLDIDVVHLPIGLLGAGKF